MSAAGGDRGDNTARETPEEMAARTGWPIELLTARVVFRPDPVPAADRQTDEARCEQCEGSGVVACWNPGGPCPIPNDPACDTCGPCNQCPAARPAHADAVMADLGAAITEFGELRGAIRNAVMACPATGVDYCTHTHEIGEYADAVLALDEMRALLDAAATVQRVEALANEWRQASDAVLIATPAGHLLTLLHAALAGEG